MYALLEGVCSENPVDWCGGEFIAGDNVSLRSFMTQARQIFRRWQNDFDPSIHRFPNGTSVFDNDEFLLSRVAIDWKFEFTPHIKRIWTDEHGGGTVAHHRLAALHLPNEKLTGIAGLFDRLVLDGSPVTTDLLTGWCGIPIRQFKYESRDPRVRIRRAIVTALKSSLPGPAYNTLRSIFRRSPI